MSVVIDPGEVDCFCGCVMIFMMFLAYFKDDNQDIITDTYNTYRPQYSFIQRPMLLYRWRTSRHVKNPLQGGNRITYVGHSSHTTWYCICSITIISMSRDFGRNLLESNQKSHEISERDEELQVNPQTKLWWPARVCWCRLGIARPQALNICIHLPNQQRKYLLELSEIEHSRTVVNWSWVHCSNSCNERSTVVATFQYRSYTTT